MKTLLLLAGLGLAGFLIATQAQVRSPAPVAVLAPLAPAAPDTVAAGASGYLRPSEGAKAVCWLVPAW